MITNLLSRLGYFLNDFKYYIYIILGAALIAGITNLLLWRFAKKKLSAKTINIFVGLAATFFSLVWLFTLTEVYFRYIYEASDGIGLLKIAQKWHQRHVVFNSHFRREKKEFTSQKSLDEFRIGVIGDSITFGIGIENPADIYTNILERKLRAEGINAVVYNLGISGIDTKDEIKDFHNLEAENLKFDMLVWEYFLNDNDELSSGPKTQITLNSKTRLSNYPVIKSLVDHSFFADFIYWRLSTRYDQTFQSLSDIDLQQYHNQALLQTHQALIRDFIQELHYKHIPIIVMPFPFIPSDTIRRQAKTEYNLMYTFFAQQPTELINVDDLFAPYPVSQLKASRFDHHPSEFAHQLVAEKLYQTIKQLVLKQVKHEAN